MDPDAQASSDLSIADDKSRFPFSESIHAQLVYHQKTRDQVYNVSRETVKDDLATLRPGFTFSILCPRSEQEEELCIEGGINRHYKIEFEDGVCWILRVRMDAWLRKDHSVRFHYRDCVEREANALIAMRDHGIMTVPRAYLPSPSSIVTPSFPTAHLYVDFAPGTPLTVEYSPLEYDHISLVEARRYLESYADHQIALAGLKFSALGQLVKDEAGDLAVGSMFESPMYADSRPFGPFETLGDRLTAFIDWELEKLRKRDWLVRMDWDDQFDVFLTLLDKRRIIKGNLVLAERREDHYLKHADDKPDQFIALDGRLSAVLDWEGAFTTTKEEAFMAPVAFCNDGDYGSLSRDEELLIAIFVEKGRGDLAECVRRGPFYRLLDVQRGSFTSLDHVKCFRKAFGVDQSDVTIPVSWAAWVAECIELYKDEPGLSTIIARHEYCEAKRAAQLPKTKATGGGNAGGL